ncbi:Protein-cysteine N-palmitoyltransferase HHAT [Myotis brandtii]|uniref:Protein-cysteine N-palmitoyltransferase HHAT n=1 Tax=Myotis brandtii TaxID=109478 RepID=S7MGD3_MYOBR|nr:Protein-cysteine N-palmitoyltransferase HHAT [Myotis brandtii]
MAYVFYYPVFHNGPILSFPEFIGQMRQPEQCPLRLSLPVLARGLGRLFVCWCLAELMVHLMYMHAFYGSAPLLRAVSCWTLGNQGNHCPNERQELASEGSWTGGTRGSWANPFQKNLYLY